MKRKETTDRKVEATLKLLEKKERFEADAFFYARLKQRIRKESSENLLPKIGLFKPLAYAASVAFIFINFYLLFELNTKQERTSYLNQMAHEFDFPVKNSTSKTSMP